MKLTVGNDTYNLTKNDKIQITDTTVIRVGNSGTFVLPSWKIICNIRNINGKLTNFIKTSKTKSPTGESVATISPSIGTAFMYIETSGDNHGNNVFVSFERTDIIQIINITFYFNRFSILTISNLKAMGRFRIQLFLEDNTWSTRCNMPKKDRYSDNSTDWTLLSVYFTIENYGIKLIYEGIGSPHVHLCFSNISITHSIY